MIVLRTIPPATAKVALLQKRAKRSASGERAEGMRRGCETHPNCVLKVECVKNGARCTIFWYKCHFGNPSWQNGRAPTSRRRGRGSGAGFPAERQRSETRTAPRTSEEGGDGAPTSRRRGRGSGAGFPAERKRSETRHAPRTSEEEDGRAPTSKGRAREARSGGKKADR